MDNLDKKVANETPGFFNHVFGFSDATKEELLNIGQYSLLSMIPVVLLNKSVQKVFPDPDEDKASYSILAEVIAQVLILLGGIFYINRFATFFSPFSKKEYGPINLLNLIVVFLIILFSFQTKVGEKVNILYERIMGYWEGDKKADDSKNKQKVKVSQPISQHPQHQVNDTPQIYNQQLLPNNLDTGNPYANGQMQQQPTTVTQNVPQQFLQEPMAANEAFGGFSSF